MWVIKCFLLMMVLSVSFSASIAAAVRRPFSNMDNDFGRFRAPPPQIWILRRRTSTSRNPEPIPGDILLVPVMPYMLPGNPRANQLHRMTSPTNHDLRRKKVISLMDVMRSTGGHQKL